MKRRTRAHLLLLSIPLSAAFAQTTTTTPTTPATPLFAPASLLPIPAGANPRAIASADFNGDQISDLAVVNPYVPTKDNPNGGAVSFLGGTLTGQLVPLQNLVTGKPYPAIPFATTPTAIAPLYFTTNASNLPGMVNLAVTTLGTTAQSPGSLTIVSRDKQGNFVLGPPFPVGGQPSSIAVADFDGDGNFDIAVANAADNTVSVFFGDGMGNFSSAKYPAPSLPFMIVPVGNHPSAIAAGNFDGFTGLVVANQIDGTVEVISFVPQIAASIAGTTPTITYLPVTYLAVPVIPGPIYSPYPYPNVYPAALTVADVNGDGLPDLITANDGSNNVSVLLGNGRGGFTYASYSPIAVGDAPMSIVSADFNGDGLPDLAIANYASGSVTVLTANSSGGFTKDAGSPYFSGDSASSVAVGDFNGAGRASLAVANETDNTVTVLLNTSTPPLTVVSGGSFNPPISPGSLIAITAAGGGLAASTATANPPLYVLGNTTVVITYNDGQEDLLPLTQVSSNQVLAVIPQSGASGAVNPVLGTATISVITPSKTQTAVVEIAPYAPALLSANGNGKGLASATFSSQSVPSPTPVAEPQCSFTTAGCPTPTPACTAGSPCVPISLNFSQGGMLSLVATGLNAVSSVLVTIGGKTVLVTPMPQASAPGTYLLNAQLSGPPPQRGLVPVYLTIVSPAGAVTNTALVSNVVTVLIL